MLGIILTYSPALFAKAGSLNQTQNSQMWLISEASFIWGSRLYLLRLELLQTTHPANIYVG